MRQELIAIIVFVSCGAFLWFTCGYVVMMLSFQTPWDYFSHEEHRFFIRGTMIWVLFGIIFGIGLCLAYRLRPPSEHFQPTYQVFLGIGGPKTVAESKVGYFGMFLGGLVGISLAIWYFPVLEIPGVITACPIFKRIILSGPAAATAALATLIFSLNIQTKIAERQEW